MLSSSERFLAISASNCDIDMLLIELPIG
jgi:hypothetical protein